MGTTVEKLREQMREDVMDRVQGEVLRYLDSSRGRDVTGGGEVLRTNRNNVVVRTRLGVYRLRLVRAEDSG
jgi:hypothetical protein